MRELIRESIERVELLTRQMASLARSDPEGASLRAKASVLVATLNDRLLSDAPAAAEAASRLVAIVESSDDAIVSTDLDGVVTSWNAAAEALFGYTAPEILGKTITVLLPPEHAGEEIDIQRRILGGERIKHFETNRLRKDGTNVCVSATISAMKSASGDTIGVSKVLRDIGDRKRLEEALLRSHRDLEDQVRLRTGAFQRANRSLRLLSDCNQTLNRATDEAALVQAMCDLMVGEGGFRGAVVYYAEQDDARTLRPVARSWVGGEPIELRAMSWAGDGGGATGAAVRSGLSVVVNDLAREPGAPPWAGDLGSVGVASIAALPLKGAVPIGAVALASTERAAFEPLALKLLVELADDIAFGIRTLRDRAEQGRDAALALERAKLEAVFENMHAGVILFDLRSGVLWMNAAATQFHGFDGRAAVPTDLEGYFRSRELRNLEGRVLAPHEWPAARGLRSEFVRDVELEVRNPRTGHVRYGTYTTAPVRDTKGVLCLLVATIQDVTVRKEIEDDLRRHRDELEAVVLARTQQLAQARDDAETANRAKSRFLANMSHEIRTPMNAVLGFTSLMLRDPDITRQQRNHLDTISRAGDQLLTLIDEILQIAKIEAGVVTLEEKTFELTEVLRDVDRLFAARARLKGLTLTVDWRGPLPCLVVADEHKLRQVLANLVGNAIKFTEIGAVTLRGEILAGSPDEPRLVLSIEDSGPGFSAAEASHLFQKFEQTESGRNSKTGTGLGLVISKGLAQLMGGDVTATSESGHGCTFRVELPLRSGSAKDLVPKADARRVERLAAGQPAVHVLIADDNEPNRAFLAELLGAVGFTTREVSDGQQAVEAFASWQPQLILMDVRMPVLGGAEAVARIRATEAGKHVKIICVTASAFDDDRREARAAGADDFVSKPVRESELFETIRSVLGLEYAYADEPAAHVRPVLGDHALTRQAVAALPADLRQRLRDALRIADFEAILDLLEGVDEAHAAVARQLRALTKTFEYGAMGDLLQPDR